MKIDDDLKTRLKIAKSKLKDKSLNNEENTSSSSFGKALGLSTEFVAAVVIGTIMGFILDSWFDTKPWLTLVFFFIGVVAGILNVFRSAKKMQNKDNI